VDKHTLEFSDTEVKSLQTDELLRQIPRNVVRNGDVYNVRGDLEVKLTSKPSQQTREVIVIESGLVFSEAESDVCVVNVKWLDNSTVFQLSLPVYATVLDIKTRVQCFLHQRHNDDDGYVVSEFALYSAYPVKLLAEDLTMQQTSCVPKGVLHAKLLTA
jgi:hypothetical protein